MPVCESCHAEAVAGAATCANCGASLAGDGSDPLVGRVLRGAYRVKERVAEGATGTVYRAVHTALEAPFAVKVLRREADGDPGAVVRFRREARALSRLRHANAVAVTDFGETEDGTLFVVMEWVTGRSLARVVADEAPLPEARVVAIGAQILAALAEAHARQILHGALTPAKVLIEPRRRAEDAVKVLGFGVANIQLAAAGVERGAAAYRSPEQRAGADLDARSDLYAVGVLLYEMLTGSVPPAAPQGPSPPSAQLGRPVAPDLEAVVMRALSTHAFERFETAEEMRAALLRAAPEPRATATDEECGPTAVLPAQDARRAPEPSPPARAVRDATPLGTRATPARPGTPRGTAVRRPSTAGRHPAAAALDAEAVREVERRALAVVGPVASYVVAKAAGVARSVDELCDIVASFIPSEPDRKAFLG
ncbi:MAG TPA: serine/threonine-protein kinase, partial [Anaeromyxobacteraceae bacterium]|nr:serine/threonine-protein kinase [Anaeromyxobacteraceae bacterium]